MRTVAGHIGKARQSLAAGPYMLAGGFTDAAGREAYMAAFHAALAFIIARTGNEPKTHHGTHVEFARVARTETGIEHAMVALLSRSYVLKNAADYEDNIPLSSEEAQAALDQAVGFVDVVCTLAASPSVREAS